MQTNNLSFLKGMAYNFYKKYKKLCDKILLVYKDILQELYLMAKKMMIKYAGLKGIDLNKKITVACKYRLKQILSSLIKTNKKFIQIEDSFYKQNNFKIEELKNYFKDYEYNLICKKFIEKKPIWLICQELNFSRRKYYRVYDKIKEKLNLIKKEIF